MADEIRRLVAEFGKIPVDLRKQLRVAIREAAKPILADAKRRADWSSRIPAATRLKIAFGKKTAGVSIVVGAKRAPHARPFEHGGQPGDFRHPVFGNRRKWVAQRARPFLAPAARGQINNVKEELREAVMTVVRENGFH